MGVIPFYTKSPNNDEFVIGLDFTDEMPEGATIATCTCTARNRKTEADATAVVLASGTNATVDAEANIAQIKIVGGVMGYWYEVFFLVVCDNSAKLQGKAVVFIDQ